MAALKVGFVKRTHTKVMNSVKSQLGAFMLVGAAFVLGYAVKNMEDHNELMTAHHDFQDQEQRLAASYSQRLAELDQSYSAQMKERDDRLNEQVGLIAEQKDMIAQLQSTTDVIAQRQSVAQTQRKDEVREVKKAAAAAQEAARGATTEDKALINTLVKKGAAK
jgi:peptidoglycan hydrolase CwlO-like protein